MNDALSTRTVSFYFQETDLENFRPKDHYLEVKRDVTISANLMDEVLEIYKGLPRQYQGFWWNNEIRPSTVAIQFVGNEGEVHRSTSPKYELNSDGSIFFLPPYAELGRGWTLAEVDTLSSHQLIDFNGRDLVVKYPQGLGSAGGFESILEWLLNFGIDFGLAGALDQSIKFVFKGYRHTRKKKLIQRIALDWSSNRVDYPSQLRGLIDTRDMWKADQLAQYLKIESYTAVQLLKALGYRKQKSGTFVISSEKKSLKKRQKWIIAEQKYFSQ